MKTYLSVVSVCGLLALSGITSNSAQAENPDCYYYYSNCLANPNGSNCEANLAHCLGGDMVMGSRVTSAPEERSDLTNR